MFINTSNINVLEVDIMDEKKYKPVNVDEETHAELLKRKNETHVAITKQLRVLVLGEKKPAEVVSDGQPTA